MVTPEEFPTGAVRTVYEDWSQWGDYQQAGQTTALYTEELKDVEVVCNEYYGYSGNSQVIYAQAFIDSLFISESSFYMSSVLGHNLFNVEKKTFDTLTTVERNDLMSFMGAKESYDIVAINKLLDFHLGNAVNWATKFKWGISYE